MENLINCPLFENMSEDEIAKVIGKQYGIRTYIPGETILDQGDEYKYLLLLLEGEVSNSMTHISGKNMFIETISAPGVIAPAIFYAEINKIPVEVTAVDTVKVLPIAKVEFNYMLQRNPKLLMNFLKMISNRSSFLSTKVRSLCFGTIKSRIAGYLLENSTYNYSNEFEIIHTQQELANMFGVTRPALSKTIKDMIDEGLINSKQKSFIILNKPELARIFRENS
ncbi:MAG TPA: Crp/Fnr family transcriptional regulator [Bacteroidales bacterium]|nr:Crp/Fnr family transcriptional regulator [Bacteroidales bacterium]